jgi:hypothetical protein
MIEVKREGDKYRAFSAPCKVTGMDGADKTQFMPYILPAPIKVVKLPIPVDARKMPDEFTVETLEGVMTGDKGDFLMTGVDGEMYPCKAEIFEKSYRQVV